MDVKQSLMLFFPGDTAQNKELLEKNLSHTQPAETKNKKDNMMIKLDKPVPKTRHRPPFLNKQSLRRFQNIVMSAVKRWLSIHPQSNPRAHIVDITN